MYHVSVNFTLGVMTNIVLGTLDLLIGMISPLLEQNSSYS